MSDTIIAREGYLFRIVIEPDGCLGPPWEEHDGHGPVSEWRTRYDKKKPGERKLDEADAWCSRYYDWQEATRIAKRDGWGVANPPEGLTRKQIVQLAVQADYDYLRRWCTGDWQWVTVGVIMLSDDDEEIDRSYIGGIESDAHEYHLEVANELIDEMLCDLRKQARAGAAAWQRRQFDQVVSL